MAKRKRKQDEAPEQVRRDGALCVHFVNTESRKRASFDSYRELVTWAIRAGVVSATDGQRLQRDAAEDLAAAAAVAHRARGLRDVLRRILEALRERRRVADEDLDALNVELDGASAARKLVAVGDGFEWVLGAGDELDRMLWPVALSAADVLTSKYRYQVRRCAGEDCDLLFVDRTAGSPRKWCSMEDCGNRVKALRHYHHTIKPRRKMTPAEVEADARRRLLGES